MSTLVAIAYRDAETADQVRTELLQATKEHLLVLDDLVVVEHRADGKVKLRQGTNLTGVGAAGGAFWGGLIGLLFLVPLFGMAVGAAGGAAAGKVSDRGVDDSFMKQLGTRLGPGGAAVIVLGRAGAPERVLERIGRYGGEVIQTSLDDEQEERLRAALGEPAATA